MNGKWKTRTYGKEDSGLEELREAQAQIGFYGKTGIGTNPGKKISLLFLYPDCWSSLSGFDQQEVHNLF